jgi:hypothetical protein
MKCQGAVAGSRPRSSSAQVEASTNGSRPVCPQYRLSCGSIGFAVNRASRACFAWGVRCFSAKAATAWWPRQPHAAARGAKTRPHNKSAAATLEQQDPHPPMFLYVWQGKELWEGDLVCVAGKRLRELFDKRDGEVESDEWPLPETARDKRVARKCDESPGIPGDGEDTRGCGGKEGWDGDTVSGSLFNNHCPYCSRDLTDTAAVIEHLDGMNRYRAGLHVPGNVLVACKRCNSEKRRDDSLKVLSLAGSGWESFLSHTGGGCTGLCLICKYWTSIWEDETERRVRLSENLERIRSFRRRFSELEQVFPSLAEVLPVLLTNLYSDCQAFAETEITSLLERLELVSDAGLRKS